MPWTAVAAKAGRNPDPASLLSAFDGKVARWWVPDAALVVPELPHTATGKLLKSALRERYGDYYTVAGAAA